MRKVAAAGFRTGAALIVTMAIPAMLVAATPPAIGAATIERTTIQPTIIYAIPVKSFIEQIRFKDRFSADAKILGSSGYITRWSEAIAGIGKITDDQGRIQTLTIFAVPFGNTIGEIKATIIGGIIQFGDGIQSHEFITTVTIPPASINAAIPSIAEPGTIVLAASVIHSIAADDRTGIWSNIIRTSGIESPDFIAAIRIAFETSGYSCSSAPAWFPHKSIWYAATCIRTDQ